MPWILIEFSPLPSMVIFVILSTPLISSTSLPPRSHGGEGSWPREGRYLRGVGPADSPCRTGGPMGQHPPPRGTGCLLLVARGVGNGASGLHAHVSLAWGSHRAVGVHLVRWLRNDQRVLWVAACDPESACALE